MSEEHNKKATDVRRSRLIRSVGNLECGVQKVPDYLQVLDEIVEYCADALQGCNCD
jgi:hypothetical protein